VRVVVDTNVLISGLFWQGPPNAILQFILSGGAILMTSPFLVTELENVLARPRFESLLRTIGVQRDTVVEKLRQSAEMVDPPALASPVCRDSDDDHVLALALSARVDCIVSGDDDLLHLGEHGGIPIVTATRLLEILQAGSPA
jgi:putative PIN family toxin of toxin-antitoxin system